MNCIHERRHNKQIALVAISLSIMFVIQMGNCEVYTAIAEMEELLETEAVIISNLESYILAQQEKLNFLRK